MRKEWLEALKEQARYDDPVGYAGEPTITEWLLPTGSLRAVLHEREALLEALRGLIEFANSPAAKAVDMSAWLHGVKYEPKDLVAWDAARAAIAKAEAP